MCWGDEVVYGNIRLLGVQQKSEGRDVQGGIGCG